MGNTTLPLSTPPPSSDPTAEPTQPPPTITEEGDASCHGFWEHGRTTIIDMRITDTDARSYWRRDFKKVLEQHKKEKKGKYRRNCLEMRVDIGLVESPFQHTCL